MNISKARKGSSANGIECAGYTYMDKHGNKEWARGRSSWKPIQQNFLSTNMNILYLSLKFSVNITPNECCAYSSNSQPYKSIFLAINQHKLSHKPDFIFYYILIFKWLCLELE